MENYILHWMDKTYVKGEMIVGWKGNAWPDKHNLSHRFIHYSYGSKVFRYVLYRSGFHEQIQEQHFPFPHPHRLAGR